MAHVENRSPELTEGGFVRHNHFGFGKVVMLATDEAYVYFPSSSEAEPAKRVRRFRLPSEFLTPTDSGSPEVENLPPWRDGKFLGMPSNLSLDGARQVFMRHFPDGLSDARFLSQEVAYKRSGHRRWTDLRDGLSGAASSDDSQQVAEVIEEIYGERQSSGT